MEPAELTTVEKIVSYAKYAGRLIKYRFEKNPFASGFGVIGLLLSYVGSFGLLPTTFTLILAVAYGLYLDGLNNKNKGE